MDKNKFPYILSEPLLNHDMLFDNLPMGALADIESKIKVDADEPRGLHIEQLLVGFKDEHTKELIEFYLDNKWLYSYSE